MELRHLRYFVTVAEELHFGRAARRLNLSQPPLSRQVQRLEAELGVTLFDRDRHRVALTRAGALLLPEARRTLQRADGVARVADRIRSGDAGRLRIGYVHSALYGTVPPLLRRFRAQVPGVQLAIRELVTSELVAAVDEDRLDVAFVRPPVGGDGLAARVVDEEPLVAVLPDDHDLAERPEIELSELAGEPFVLFPRPLGEGLWDMIVQACVATGFTPRIVQESPQIHTIVGLVAAGVGVTLVPSSVRRLALPGVRYVGLTPSSPAALLAVLWAPTRAFPALERFLDVASGGPGEGGVRGG